MFTFFRKSKIKVAQKKEIFVLDFSLDKISILLKKSSKSKGVRISLKSHDASVVVTYGRFVPQILVKKFIESKKDWIIDRVKKLKEINPILRIKHSKDEKTKYFKDAMRLVEEKLPILNSHYNFEYKKVFIKDQKTKWGSCSSSKNLTFNYKIIFLPPNLQDYLIVHELCHLKEMNHSRAFWSLVGERVGDYKALSKKLRTGHF